MDAEHWTSHLIRFTANPDDVICTSIPAWKYIPTAYIICEDDQFLPERLQCHFAEKTSARLLGIESAGHDAFIGKCEDIVETVGQVVGSFMVQ
jgi:pimeloyl-ACP methyl ester carboxylesterase